MSEIDLEAALRAARERIQRACTAAVNAPPSEAFAHTLGRQEHLAELIRQHARLARAVGAWEWQRDPKSEETCWARAERIAREVQNADG